MFPHSLFSSKRMAGGFGVDVRQCVQSFQLSKRPLAFRSDLEIRCKQASFLLQCS